MDPNTPNRIAEEYEAKLAAVKTHFEAVVRDLQTRLERGCTVNQVLQDGRFLTIVHVELTGQGLTVHVK